jgi:hypothetical protein
LIVFDCFSKHRVFSGSAGSAQSICPLAFDFPDPHGESRAEEISILPRGAASKDGKRHGTAAMAQVSATDLECRLTQAQRELSEAREQQAATAEVLRSETCRSR